MTILTHPTLFNERAPHHDATRVSRTNAESVLLKNLVAAGLAPVVVPLNASVTKSRIRLAAVKAECQSMTLRAFVRFGRACTRLFKQFDATTERIDLAGKSGDPFPNGDLVEQLQQIGDRNHGHPNPKSERSHADTRRLGDTSTIYQVFGDYSAERWLQDAQRDRRTGADRIHLDRSAVYPPGRTTKQPRKLANFLTADDDWIARNQGKTIVFLLTAAMVVPGVIEWMI